MGMLVTPNAAALWEDAIKDAEQRCLVTLHQEIETYLISVLNRYLNQPDITKQIFAYAFLNSMKHTPHERAVSMQAVGDQCLLFAGLFPEQASKKLVTIRYFVDVGCSAYSAISINANDLFDSLAAQFVVLTDILQSIRPTQTLLPLEAYDQWQQIGSQRALRLLREYTQGIPIKHS